MMAANAMCFCWYSIASWYKGNYILHIWENILKKYLKYQPIRNSEVRKAYAYEKSNYN